MSASPRVDFLKEIRALLVGMHRMRTPEGLHLYISLLMWTKVLARRASRRASVGSEGELC
jgi:hypothetical protein